MHFVPSRFRHLIPPLLVPALFAIAFFAGQTAAHFLRRPSGHTVSAPVIACGSLPPAFDSGSIPVSADGNRGLGLPSPGQTAVGNASADTLKNFDAFYVGDTSKPVIYLTFDAGYENGYTHAILEALKKQNLVFRWVLIYALLLAVVIFGMYGPGYYHSVFLYAKC